MAIDIVNAQLINGAIKMLERTGAVFKIVDKYGTQYGNLNLEDVAPKKARKKRQR
jgi:hypothetical protein